ncbi:MAG: beta strand repeat-containing protein, partial [Limisphaerales bacterium]
MKRLLSFFAGFLFLLRAGAQPATGIHVMAYSANAASLATSPATTQASGSTILVWIGNGALSLLSGFPTDNKGNKYVSLGSHSYAPDWPSSGEALYVCTNAVGGSGHIFDWSNGTAVESTMMVVEVKNGGAIHNVQWNEVTTVSGSQTSLYATNSAPASIVAVWVGDAGATTSSATPNNSFAVLNAQTLASGYVEGVTASKDLSAAGTNNVTWTCSPGQGAHMWMVAVQASQTGIAAPSLNWSNPADIVYGTPLGSSQLNATATFNSTNVSGTFTYAPPGGTILNAGRAQTLSVTFTPTDTSALRAVSQNVTINVDPLAVVLAGSRNYDGTTAAAAAILSVANVVGGDVVTVASGSGTLAGAGLGPQALTGVGTLALGGAAAANYTLSGASGTVTIHTAPLTITAAAQAKTYGAALSLGTTAFSVGSGLAAGQTVTGVSLTANGGTAATAPVGSYVITPSGATGAGGFLAGNYNITYSTGTLAVNPLAVVLAGSRNYDGTTVAAAAILSVANVVGSDVVTVASGSGTLAGAGLGPQALTGSGTLALGGAAAANYTLSGASGTVTIHAAPLTITATAQAKAYGAALSMGTTAFSVGSGLAAGQTVTGVSLTANGGTAATAPVGSYVITPNGATGAGGFLAGNYNITYSTATLTVNKAILTVTANNAIRVYGQANPAFGANYAG